MGPKRSHNFYRVYVKGQKTMHLIIDEKAGNDTEWEKCDDINGERV